MLRRLITSAPYCFAAILFAATYIVAFGGGELEFVLKATVMDDENGEFFIAFTATSVVSAGLAASIIFLDNKKQSVSVVFLAIATALFVSSLLFLGAYHIFTFATGVVLVWHHVKIPQT